MSKNTPATTVVEALTRTREILKDESRWVKGEWATERGGKVCYCLDGALQAAVMGATDAEAYEELGPAGGTRFESLDDDLYEAARNAMRHGGVDSPIWFNDDPTRTHAELLEMLDTSIEKASA